MKSLVLLVLVAVTHIVYLLSAYGSGLFGLKLPLPHYAVLSVWLGLSSVLAYLAYFKIGSRWRGLSSLARSASFAFAATLCSLYVGVFLAFNTFGT